MPIHGDVVSPSRIRVLIVDDHQLVRDALSSVLERESDVVVVGSSGDGESAIKLCDKLGIDVALIDIALPGISGIEATRSVLAANPSIKVIAVSTYIERSIVEAMLSAGASGYINKAAGGSELLLGIRTVFRGQPYLSRNVAEMMAQDPKNSDDRVQGSPLGRRETEVLKLVVEGLSSAQIAARLHIAVGTVDVHRRNITLKLKIHSLADLTKYAIREGLTKV